MKKSKVLIVGATGYLGKRLVRASLAQGHETYVVYRPEIGVNIEKVQMLLSFKEQGARWVEASFNDHRSLVNAVKLVDVVICAISGIIGKSHEILLQLKLVDAIKEAGNIKRFLPSEFGTDPARMGNALEPGRVTFDDKMVVRKAIEEANIPFTYISANCFAGYFLGGLCQPGLKLPSRDSVLLFGDGNQKAIYVDEDDIAMYSIKTIDDPRTLNKTVYIRPPKNILSQREVVQVWENLIGKKLNKSSISEEDFLAKLKGVLEMDASQANDVEDWDRLKRVMDTLGPITIPGDVPRTEGGDDSHVVVNIPSPREELLREEASHGRSSKKKRRSHKDGSRKASRTERHSDSKGQGVAKISEASHLRYEEMLEHLKHQFEETNCDITAVGYDVTECRLMEDAVAQVYIRTRAIRHSYDELLRKNKEKRDLLTAMTAKVATLEEKCQVTERERAQSAKAQVNLKVSLDRTENLVQKQRRQIDEKDQMVFEKDQRIIEKDLKIAEWEKRYNLAKYAGALWAKDQTLLRFPDAQPFVEWLEPPADEPKVDIGDGVDEAT